MSDSAERTAVRIAQELLRIGAVTLSPGNPYTWVSGRKAPVYCDNRLTLGYPDVRSLIAKSFESAIKAAGIKCDVIVGTATAGIPHAASLADLMGLPLAYVRNSPKQYGRANQIEGLAPRGSRAVVIEDLVSTGRSSTAVLAPLKEAGVDVQAIFAIFTYGLNAADSAFREANIRLYTLSSFPVLVKEASRMESLSQDDLNSLELWYKDPSGWSRARGGE